MNKIITLFFVIGLSILISCGGNEADSGGVVSKDAQENSLSEEELMRLAMLIEPSPKSYQADQMNKLVQYAIDHNWPVQQSESGLLYYIQSKGDGDKIGEKGKVMVQYKGYLVDDRVFDSSFDRGQPSIFTINEVIPAWQEGLQYIREGGTIYVLANSDLGYGARGAGKLIKPYTPLIFEIELVSIVGNSE
ncbi:FKBP-type peptidyl-prolyl cis-trans isomerase [Membranihabitans maritimus]|uniref:FKBP-type peptidyl-prolyl cis-trans isomerase n=1 Tax=Membranihabitans maritimus TaxID=2904244 RepID=UPI001EFFABEE|nr:FKBP-type peptidyl-prolyl cis-trans isomerase [Membranihabitans maritimus]